MRFGLLRQDQPSEFFGYAYARLMAYRSSVSLEKARSRYPHLKVHCNLSTLAVVILNAMGICVTFAEHLRMCSVTDDET